MNNFKVVYTSENDDFLWYYKEKKLYVRIHNHFERYPEKFVEEIFEKDDILKLKVALRRFSLSEDFARLKSTPEKRLSGETLKPMRSKTNIFLSTSNTTMSLYYFEFPKQNKSKFVMSFKMLEKNSIKELINIEIIEFVEDMLHGVE